MSKITPIVMCGEVEEMGNDFLSEVGAVDDGYFDSMQQTHVCVVTKHGAPRFLIKRIIVVLQEFCNEGGVVSTLH